jgi:hypothetical protein
MAAVFVPVEETVVSYQPAVFVEDAGRLVKSGNVSQVCWTLKLSQTATIRSFALAVAAVVPVEQFVLEVVSLFVATLSTSWDAHDVAV